MKTALEQLNEWMENTPNKPLTHEIVKKIHELFDVEREQIINAHNQGRSDRNNMFDADGNDYFRKTFIDVA